MERSPTQWHCLKEDEVVRRLATSVHEGLSSAAAEQRLQEHGLNTLTSKRDAPAWRVFLQQLGQPLIYILLGATLVTSLLGEWVDAGVIFTVVLVNAVIGYIQESRALRAIRALSHAMTSEARVLRDGSTRRQRSEALVPGDIVLLSSGDKVPADLRLLRCRELKVNESALTGESLPVAKDTHPRPPACPLADRGNMVYSSTLVTCGTALGVVVATGDGSEIGRINALINTADVLATPLTRRITRFSRVLLYAILGLAALTFGVGLLHGGSWVEMFMASVALAVGAIPEGLPAALTITLAIGVAKMAHRNAIIRKLPAVETLGSTTVICSDKTGTLTENQMTVQRVYAGGATLAVSGVGYVPDGHFSRAGQPVDPTGLAAVRECLVAGLLCNDAKLARDADGSWRVEGDPTEGALITVAHKAGLYLADLGLPRIDSIPFESQHQYMATLHRNEKGRYHTYLKGAAESLLQRCEYALDNRGERIPLDFDHWHGQVTALARQGMRVLAFARDERTRAPETLHHRDVESGLTLLGLQGMIDPPRPEAAEAVAACREAGIQVKMITGDHAATASAIARQVGISQDGEAVITGSELEALDFRALEAVAAARAVFARVAPEQKLRLVQALQARGQVVAMTGDGVNDAPALRRADIGVAMGITGTEVSKEAADMVLTDDNFASIRAAVEEGRGVYDNLVKFITWTLPTNLGEGLVILSAVLAGITLPILPVQILWINMTTAVLLGLMLAFEPKEPDLMARPPRDPRASLLSTALLVRIALVGLLLLLGAYGLFRWELAQGSSETLARTVTVNVFVFGELFYLFNCRSLRYSMLHLGVFSNPWLLLGVATMIGLQLLYTYAPAMNTALGSAPIGGEQWLRILGVSLSIYLIVGIEKWVARHLSRAE
ncbi:cation-transporting P-type ATPase [Motiliproteus sp. SC1-56]|uniref:cation-transporting P-type ATPase n=1 Tax=Motiliproteus sp. SC1-56 TaxID=2799565 RepID=UPI002107EDB8|nr:cation-transporting P-type ATPase [Motiliproteus sp. SC1-56]